MNLVNVVAIAKNSPQGELSYFSSRKFAPGDVVYVILRKKKVPAMVVSSADVKQKKSQLKHWTFTLKRISSSQSAFRFSKELTEIAKEAALWFGSPLGSVLSAAVSSKIFEHPLSAAFKSGKPGQEKRHHQIVFIEGNEEERIKYYKNIIREEFAKNRSVFVCLPEISKAEKTAGLLSSGIENRTLLLHSGLSKKKMEETCLSFQNIRQPALLVSTGVFLCLVGSHFGTIIIENEGLPHYKMKNRPFLDWRTLAFILSKKLKIRLALGDFLPRLETHWQKKNGLISEISQSKRILTKAKNILADTRELKGEIFRAVGPELEELIVKSRQNKEKILLFVSRRGHSPTTLCSDCGKTIICPNCFSPLVLHQKGIRFMLCHKCLSVLEAAGFCPSCKSWRLKTLGIGIQKAEEEIRKIVPAAEIFRLDSDVVKTRKQGEKLIEEFNSKKGGLLLATEMVFSYFGEKDIFSHLAVVSADNLLTIPDFRINERLFRLLLSLKKMARETFLIQTRLPEQKLFNYALQGNSSAFLEEELEARKKFGYPPFSLLIKISKEDKSRPNLQKNIKELTARLQEFSPLEFPSFVAKIKNKYRWNVLLKLKPEKWPNEKLSARLSELGPGWQVNVDPDNLL